MGRVSAADRPLTKVVTLKVRAGRKDQIRKFCFAAHPAVLVDHGVDLVLAGITIQFDIAVGLSHGSHEGSAVTPEHFDFSFDRIFMMRELLMYALSAEAFADELTLSFDDVFRIVQTIQALCCFGCCIFDICCTGFTHLRIRLCITREPGVVSRSAHGRSPDGNAGLTEALHCCKCDQEACLLCTVSGTACGTFTAANAAGKSNLLGSPFFCQCADPACRDAAFFSGPFRSLRNTVLFAEDVSLELFKAFGAVFNIEVIVCVIDDPLISDRCCQGSVRSRTRCKPGAVHNCVGVVVERIDKDALHSHFFQPYTPDVGFLTGIDAVRGVRVIRPEHDHFRVLECVRQKVELLRLSETPGESVHMRSSPHPAFPGIRVVQDRCVVQHREETSERSHLVADDSPVVVGAGDGCDCMSVKDTVFVTRSKTIDLLGDNGCCFIP